MTATEPGVYIDRLPKGTQLLVETAHRNYLLEIRGGLNALISGHPNYCPDPVPVVVCGSRARGFEMRRGFIGRGMRLEFWHPARGIIRTSAIWRVRILFG